MNKEKISVILDGIDDRYINEATVYRHRSKRRAAAICAALLIVCSTAVVFAVDAKEYNIAEAFFRENGISTAGLSRSEVKAVYRDITTKSFTYGMTAEVIKQAVSGLEITLEEPTAEDLAAIWDRKVWMETLPKTGIGYRRTYRQISQEPPADIYILECYKDGSMIWSVQFNESLEGYTRTGSGTAAWAINMTWSSAEKTYAYLTRIDDNGKVLWKERLDHGFSYEYIAAVIDNGDGTWAVVSRGDFKYVCISQYDMKGKELSFNKTEVGNFGIWNAARLGDGYMIQIGSGVEREYARILRMDREGRITGDFSYKGDDCEYYITDMAEFGGRVYLSAYAVPQQEDEGARHEIANILDHIFEQKNMEISDEELTPMVRDNYTAVLLLVDPEVGTPETFYSVKGALGGKLSVTKNGILEWDAESIVSTFFSPATSSFTIGGKCKVFRYTFDASGNLLGQEDTGEMTTYAR